MAIVVEDGTGVAGANSYLTEAAANAILAGFGLPVLTSAEARLRTACHYLEGYRAQYKGEKTASDQALQWPRAGVYLDGYLIDNDVIPDPLKNAQALLANLVQNGVSLYSNGNGQETIEKTVDVITVKYAESGVSGSQPEFGIVMAQLNCLLKSSKISLVRV